MILFGEIRKNILENWLKLTGRLRSSMDDEYPKYECSWQTNWYTDPDDNPHYSVFCSMGDWNTNITDLLEDKRFDKLNFENEDHKKILFRFYTRFFLIASEIFTDFQDMLSTINAEKILNSTQLNSAKNKSREEMNKKYIPDGFGKLFQYINNIHKHKLNNLHKCNHHIKFYFQDSRTPKPDGTIIDLESIYEFFPKSTDKAPKYSPSHIEVPQLSLVSSLIIFLYQYVDDLFRDDPFKYEKFRVLFAGEEIDLIE